MAPALRTETCIVTLHASVGGATTIGIRRSFRRLAGGRCYAASNWLVRQFQAMNIDLTADQWAQLDALILSRSILLPLKLICEWSGVHFVEAMNIRDARYRQLREERPDDFCCSDEEYWVGVYS